MRAIPAAGHFAVPEGEPNQYRAHLFGAGLEVGTYCVPVGGKDGQEPHGTDEIYVVMRGRARLVSDADTVDVAPGTVVFVPAGEPHWFTDVSEDLSVVAVFAADGHVPTPDV